MVSRASIEWDDSTKQVILKWGGHVLYGSEDALSAIMLELNNTLDVKDRIKDLENAALLTFSASQLTKK